MTGPFASALAHPLVLIGLGPMGMRAVADLDETATALAAPARSMHCTLAESGERLDRLGHRFTEGTSRLLEAGVGSEHGTMRLDVVVLADGAEVDAKTLTQCLEAITTAITEAFPVLFPPNAPADQRTIWLSVFLGTPPLVATAEGSKFAETLSAVDRFAASPPHPALSRVALLARQTSAGRLDDEGLEEALRSIVQTLFLSGLRTHDRVRGFLAHRPDSRRFATVGLATAELPVARIRHYARWRLALSGLQTLLDQAETPTTDPSRAEALRQQLDGDRLLSDFHDGDAAQRVRGRAATLSGAEDHLPTQWGVRLTERAIDLRSRYRVLFEPITKPWNRRTDPTTDPDHEAMLRLVDAAEAGALAEADRRLASLLDDQLDPASALQLLPPLEHALKQALHGLNEELAAEVPVLPSPEPPPPTTDPGLNRVERVIDGRPGLARTWPTLLALSTSAGAMVMLGVSWLMAADPTGPLLASSNPLPPTTAEGWAVGILFGVLVAFTWQFAVLWSWRLAARHALEKRTHELDSAWRRGGAGQEREQAEQLLAVRRRRTARDLRRRYEAALERLASLRAAIRQAATHASDSLADLRVRLGPTPRQDELTGLLGTETALHRALIGPRELAARLERSGGQHDANRWAGQILAATWPRVGGLWEDLPCLDEAALLRACDGELGTLTASDLLGDTPADMTERTAAFLSDAVGALGWGIDPRDAHGDPVKGQGRDRRLVLASVGLRAAVERALADTPARLDPLWSNAEVPWVTVLAWWDGLEADEITRGMGIR